METTIHKDIPSEITRLHKENVACLQSSLDRALRIGQLLTSVKENLGHGEWLPWLRVNLPFTERTAQNYLRLFENREKLKCENVSDLRQAYRLLAESAKAAESSIDPLDIPIYAQEWEAIVASRPPPMPEQLERIDDWDLMWAFCVHVKLKRDGKITRRELREIVGWAEERRQESHHEHD